MISWFVLTVELSAGLQNTRQCICSDWKTLENQSAKLEVNSCLKGILPKHFFFSRRLQTTNCEIRRRKNYADREVHEKPVRKPPIRKAHICPCDTAGYLNELLCTNSQTEYKWIGRVRPPAATQARKINSRKSFVPHGGLIKHSQWYGVTWQDTLGPFVRGKIRRVLNKTRTFRINGTFRLK